MTTLIEMPIRNIGRTGMFVSALGLGSENFGPSTPEAAAFEIIDTALDAGINFIDTADMYGTDAPGDFVGMGQSETIVGNALKRNGRRGDVILASKFALAVGTHPNQGGASRRHMMRAVEGSLRRLQTDYLDLYQIHGPDDEVDIDETLRGLDDLVHSGKVRYIGTSNFRGWEIVEALWKSDALRLNRVVSEQAPYNITNRLREREVFPVAQKFNIAIFALSPLFGGVLSGKYRRGQAFPEGSRFANELSERNYPRRYLSDRVFDLLEGLEKIAQEKGCTLTQFSIAWLLSNPVVTSVLIGPRTLAQLQDNIGALAVQITDEDKARVDALIRPRDTIMMW